MFSAWEDDDGPESGWSPELSFGDPDVWRGRSCADVDEAWRGGVHLVEWPVWNAGPEYFMWKRLAEGEES